MTIQIKGHAKEVVERFKEMLDDNAIEEIQDEHFEELETLIEASLSVVHSQAQHDFAKELEGFAKRMRKGSSHYDS